MLQDQSKGKLKKNIFVYRMKKIIKRRSMEKSSDMESSVIGVNFKTQRKESFERLVQKKPTKKQGEFYSKSLAVSETLRRTLSPRQTKMYEKNPNSINKRENNKFQMPQLSEVQKNRNKLSLIFSLTSNRPLWRSLELNPPHRMKNSSYSNKKCVIFRKAANENPEVEFYNTNNIFILKKVKQSPLNVSAAAINSYQGKPASIKYKKKEAENLSSGMKLQDKYPTKEEGEFGKNLIAEVRNDLAIRKARKGTMEGIGTIEPWMTSEDQKINSLRISPMFFH